MAEARAFAWVVVAVVVRRRSRMLVREEAAVVRANFAEYVKTVLEREKTTACQKANRKQKSPKNNTAVIR